MNKKRFLTYNQAKARVQSIGLKTAQDYYWWVKVTNPTDMPRRPYHTYRKSWKGWPSFLGSDK